MLHMWVNTVTGCGLPDQEINGLRVGILPGPERARGRGEGGGCGR